MAGPVERAGTAEDMDDPFRADHLVPWPAPPRVVVPPVPAKTVLVEADHFMKAWSDAAEESAVAAAAEAMTDATSKGSPPPSPVMEVDEVSAEEPAEESAEEEAVPPPPPPPPLPDGVDEAGVAAFREFTTALIELATRKPGIVNYSNDGLYTLWVWSEHPLKCKDLKLIIDDLIPTINDEIITRAELIMLTERDDSDNRPVYIDLNGLMKMLWCKFAPESTVGLDNPKYVAYFAALDRNKNGGGPTLEWSVPGDHITPFVPAIADHVVKGKFSIQLAAAGIPTIGFAVGYGHRLEVYHFMFKRPVDGKIIDVFDFNYLACGGSGGTPARHKFVMVDGDDADALFGERSISKYIHFNTKSELADLVANFVQTGELPWPTFRQAIRATADDGGGRLGCVVDDILRVCIEASSAVRGRRWSAHVQAGGAPLDRVCRVLEMAIPNIALEFIDNAGTVIIGDPVF